MARRTIFLERQNNDGHDNLPTAVQKINKNFEELQPETGLSGNPRFNRVGGAWYGTKDAPISGNVTLDPTGAIESASVAIYHQDATAPSFGGMPVEAVTGAYNTSNLNLIIAVATPSRGVLLSYHSVFYPLFIETFDGTTIDLGGWSITGDGFVQNEVLTLGNASSDNGNTNKFKSVIEAPSTSAGTVVLRFTRTIVDGGASASLQFGLFDKDAIDFAGVLNGTHCSTGILAADRSGKIRVIAFDGTTVHSDQTINASSAEIKIKIVGDTASLYYWSGSAWTQLGSSVTDVAFETDWRVGSYVNNGSTDAVSEVEIDDVYLTNYDYDTRLPL